MTRPADPASVRAVGWACLSLAIGVVIVLAAGLLTAYLMDWFG